MAQCWTSNKKFERGLQKEEIFETKETMLDQKIEEIACRTAEVCGRSLDRREADAKAVRQAGIVVKVEQSNKI